jgi:L-arabinokinase
MLCYYVTGHGFGHAVRTTQILKALPPELPLIVKTTAPERLFREELPGREFEVVAAEYDCGCLQSDSVSVLKRETLTRYAEIAKHNRDHLADETAFLRERGVKCVASDIPSFPLYAAREVGVPSAAVGNFTWHGIYAEYAETGDDHALLAQMAQEYAAATVGFVTPLSLPAMPDLFPNTERVPLVARRGSSIRDILTEVLDIPVDKHLALLYLGGWGLEIDWPALERCTDWVFLLDRPLPAAPANARAFDPGVLRYADVAASVDAVVSKAGYGTVTECIANSVPLVYLPRTGFAEHDALVSGMNRWGGGIEIAETAFHAGDWASALNTALTVRPDPNAFSTSGAEVIAERLTEMCR